MKDTIFYFVDNREHTCPFRRGSVCVLKHDSEGDVYDPCHYAYLDFDCMLDHWDVLVFKNGDEE